MVVMKKKAAALGLALMLSAGAEGKSIEILASFYPVYVSALNVVGDTPGVEVKCLTGPITGCLHDYSLTPRDMKALSDADVFVANGAGMESFLGKVVKESPGLKIVDASRNIELLPDGNPHVWVSVSGAIEQVRNIADGLAAADPVHAQEYRDNAAAYVRKLEILRRRMHAALDGVRSREIITFHEAFPYFAKEFDLKIVGVIEREPGSEPGARELAKTIETVKSRKVKALFAEPQYPVKSAKVIERETGVPVSILDPVVTGPADLESARDSYFATMEKNLEALLKALNE
jgi:zinc transport system substrate-binding protein